jgi:hypothetical protein
VPDPDPKSQTPPPDKPPDVSSDTTPDETPATSSSSVKPRRRRRRYVIGALVLLLMVVGGVFFLTRSARLAGVIESVLEDSIGCDARIGQVHLTWGGELTVDGIDLSVPGMTGEGARLLHSDRVVVQLRFLPLLIGRVRASSVALTDPTLYLTEDLDDDLFNYEKLIAQPPSGEEQGGLPGVLPEIFLSGGEVRFGQVSGGEYEPVEGFKFDGTLTADDALTDGYTFILNQHASGGDQAGSPHGPTIQGAIDLSVPEIEVQIDRFTFSGPHRFLLPRGMRLWWDRLSPKGDLPKVIFGAGLDKDGLVTLSAEMWLDGIGLSLPVQEGQPLLLTDVSGRVMLTEGVIEFLGVTGELEGITFTADGQIQGVQAQSPFWITVSTEPFEVPAQGGIWPKLPQRARRYQERFSPQGMYQAQVTIDRLTPGAALRSSGYLDLLDTRFSYHKFPYPADQLTGRVTFDSQRVEFHDLQASSPSGGHATVSGTITPPGGGGEVDITIRGDDFPVDDYLLDAMKPKHRKIMDMFFNESGYQELIAQGVVRAPGEASSESSGATAVESDSSQARAGAPVFEPGGTAAVNVRIQRPAGVDQKYRVTTDLDVSGLRTVFSFWHYPLYAERGRVVITPGEVEIHNVRVRAVGGGGGVVDGRLVLPTDGQPLEPYIQLASIRLPINHTLISSIPKPKDQWVGSLQLGGTLVGTGEVFAGADGKVAFTVDTVLQNGSATPNGGSYALTDIQGFITIERSRIQFEDLKSKHDLGSISLNGQADFGVDGLGVDLTFAGDELRLERGLIDLLPSGHEGRPILQKLFDDYTPDGRFDASLQYTDGNDEPGRFLLDIDPRSLNLDYSGQRIDLDDMTGRVELTSQRAILHKLAGRFASGTFEVDGEVRLNKDPGVNLSIDVLADQIDDTARALVPPAVLAVIDKLEVQGPYSVQDAHLLTWPTVLEGPTAIFEGKVYLHDADAQIGVAVTELNAELDMHVATFAEQRWPHTDIRIQAEDMRVADRLVERVSFTAKTGRQPWLIELADMKGSIYGGTLVGWGQMRLGRDAALGLDLTIQEVELEPFLNPLETAGPKSTDAPDAADITTRNMASGLLSARVTLRIPSDDPTQMQGRGVINVRDARLYDRPITLALLQAASLALPSESSFDRASARYIVYGSTVQFDDIRFEAPAFVIAGTGTMEYPSTELNLRMVTQNPSALDLGPVSTLVQTFTDELLGIEVRGTLAQPQARVVTLDDFFKSWGRVFGGNSAQMTEDPPAELPDTP